MEELSRIVESMALAARKAGVSIVTGDTKVVNRGSADKLFITTAGVGLVPEASIFRPRTSAQGDDIIVSGSIADHGMAVMSVREGMEFEGAIVSDTAALNSLVAVMLARVKCMPCAILRAGASPRRFARSPAHLPWVSRSMLQQLLVREDVKGACEILGLDPLFVANEGKLVAFVSQNPALPSWTPCARRVGREARIVGRAVSDHPGMVLLKTEIGGTRVLDLPFTEQLPRIC